MTDVHLQYINPVHVKVIAEPSIIMELADAFTWYAEGYKWSPRYKARQWDGKISMVNRLTGICLAGLSQRIKKFCDSRDYSFSFDDELCYENISKVELEEFIKTLDIPEKFEIRDYQFNSILKCIRSNRRTLVSPTSSGKSLMIYIINSWYRKVGKGLIIVPTINLCSQMRSDFRDYGYKGPIPILMSGQQKNTEREYIKITLENGEIFTLSPEENVKTSRGIVSAANLREDDNIINFS